MPVSEPSYVKHRPKPRDPVARWQTYADLLEAEVERRREITDYALRLLGPKRECVDDCEGMANACGACVANEMRAILDAS